VEQSVGTKLREARKRRQLGLPEAEEATKIRGRYLQAIEEDEWDELPGDTYARAFIRTYGRFLGLDGEQLAEDQRRARGSARPGEQLPRVDPRPRPVARERRRRRRRLTPRALIALVTALVVAALLAIGLATGGGSGGGDGGGGRGKAERTQPQPHVGDAVPVR
jgi:cytoskeleton protein RodZ